MSTNMPDTIQQALGEAATRDFTPWLETFMTERTVGQDTWKLAQTRFDGLEQRQTAFETRLTAVETRLTIVEHDLSEIKVELREFKREVNERFDRLTAMFNERFDRQAAEMNARFAEVSARFDHQAAEVNVRFDRLQQQMLSQTRWTVGTLALFGTLIAILVGIGQLRP